MPFTWLTNWVGYAIWVWLIAKLLGGKATISQMLGATALYTVPHILDVLGFVPCLGSILSLVATVWGIAIYIKGLTVANDFSLGKSILAAILPALIRFLVTMGGILTLVIIALLGG